MYTDLKILFTMGFAMHAVIAAPLATRRLADVNTSPETTLTKRIIRPDLTIGALTALAGVYLGTQMEDDTHSDNLLETVGEKILEYDEERKQDNS